MPSISIIFLHIYRHYCSTRRIGHLAVLEKGYSLRIGAGPVVAMNLQIAQVLFGLFREDLGVNSSAAGVSWPPDVSTGFPMRVRGDFALRLAPVHRSLVRTSVRG